MNKKEYTDFIKRYSLLNAEQDRSTIARMVELQDIVFSTLQGKNNEQVREDQISFKIRRQMEFARLADKEN